MTIVCERDTAYENPVVSTFRERTNPMDFRFACLSVSALAVTSWVAGCGSSAARGTGPNKSMAGSSAGADGGGGLPSTSAEGCPVNSGYVGDDRCLAAPSATEGFQM